MNSFEQKPTIAPEKLTLKAIEEKLAKGENLENLDLHDLNLAGLNFEGKKFSGSDVRGLSFYGQTTNEAGEVEDIITNLNNTEWKDCFVSSWSNKTELISVDAVGAKFGFTESLASRRQRQLGKEAEDNDSGAYLNFDGSNSNFELSKWQHIDFGGLNGYNATFEHANFSQATFIGCDLRGLDFSTNLIKGLRIIDPQESLEGLIITESQISDLAQAIEFKNPQDQEEFLADLKSLGERQVLEKKLGVNII